MKPVFPLLITLFLGVVLSSAAAGFDEGKQYQRLAAEQPTTTQDKIEVVELFWYGCPHCYYLEPYLEKWLDGAPDDVVFVRLPAILGSRWELLARAYFTAEILGVMDKVHKPLFEALHVKKQKIHTEAALQDFFIEQGVSASDFKSTFNSFAVAVKLNNARMMTRRYALTGVPTLIINGKFKTSPSSAGSNENVIQIIDYLIARERTAPEPEQAASAARP